MKIVFTILFTLLALCSFAQDKPKDDKKGGQKKEEYKVSSTIKTVRGFLKDSKNVEANNEVEKAVKQHPEARSSAQLYALKSQALHALVLGENRKMYLNQKPDTSKYFSYIYSLYEAALTCDSLDQLPDAKGRVQLKYRDTNQQRLLQFRKNLSTADRYYYLKKDYQNAFKFGNLYLSTKHSPIFNKTKGGTALTDENDSVAHASLAVFLAYAYNNNKGVAKYIPTAMHDTARLAQIYEVGSKAYYELKDTISAHYLLFKGVKEFPTTDYFYMTLLKYYNEKKDYEKGLELVDSVLNHMPDNRNAWFLKAREHEYLEQHDKAIYAMSIVVEKHPEDYEAYAALGNMHLDKAHRLYQNFNMKVTDKGYQQGRRIINESYADAKDAFEKCKKYAEQKTDLWLDGLRECYYKLSFGKELKLLENLK